MAAPDLTEIRLHGENEDLRRQIADLQVKNKLLKAKTADYIEAVRQGARDATVAIGNPPSIQRPRADRRSKRAEVCVLQTSDWHFGKLTPSFNSEVAAKRVAQLAEKVTEITEIERAAHPVRECHLLALGDKIEGVMIFPGQAWEIDSSIFSQMMSAASSFEGLLRSLLATFDTVHVWLIDGNHGRIGKKGDAPVEDNTDRLLYQIVRERFPKEKRLVWHEQRSWYSILEIGSYRGLLVHGHQIKSFGGTPIFAILKRCNAWAAGVLPPFRDVFMGHFHTDLILSLANGKGRVFVNPALESDSAFATEHMGANGLPSQHLFYVDPVKARVTTPRTLWLD